MDRKKKLTRLRNSISSILDAGSTSAWVELTRPSDERIALCVTSRPRASTTRLSRKIIVLVLQHSDIIQQVLRPTISNDPPCSQYRHSCHQRMLVCRFLFVRQYCIDSSQKSTREVLGHVEVSFTVTASYYPNCGERFGPYCKLGMVEPILQVKIRIPFFSCEPDNVFWTSPIG